MLVTPTDLATGGVNTNTPEPRDHPDAPGVAALETVELPRAALAQPAVDAIATRSRRLTLRGATKPTLETPAGFSAAPSCEHTATAPAFEEVPVLSTTAVHGGWGALPSDRNAREPARWSERSDEDRARKLLSETLREFQPRQRSDSTLRVSLARPAVTDPHAVPPVRTQSSYRGALISAGCVSLLLALVIAARLPVASTTSAQGVLQSSVSGDAVVAPLAGIVRELPVARGERVAAGQTLAIIDPVDQRERLAQTLQEIAQIEHRQVALRQPQAAQQRNLDALRVQAVALRRRYDADGQHMARLREQRRSYERLVQHGFAAQGGLEDLAQEMRDVWRDVLAGEQQMASNRQQQLALEQERNRETQALRAELIAALATRDELEAALEQSTLVAKAKGRFEGPLAIVGERVEMGQLLARVVPMEAPMRASLEVSAPVRLRVGAKAVLTVEEPGVDAYTLDARISAIHVLAEPSDEATGSATSMRVEVELSAPAGAEDLAGRLAPGTHVTAALSGVPRPLLKVALEEWSAFTETL